MAISLYDQCTTTDWENIALRVSQVSAALALVISIVALSLGYLSWVSFYTLAVGLVLSIWELPIIYYCIPAGGPCFCKELEAKAVQIFMKNAIVKAALYTFLSVATFFQRTICTIAGLALLLAGLVNAMAAICHELNVRDGLVGDTADDTSIDERAATINKFGTF